VEAVARKIVQAAANPSKFKLEDLYTEASTSVEPGGGAAVKGLAGLRQKNATWEQMQVGTTWRAKNVLTKGNTVIIEWDADVTLRGGRKINLQEIAVHEIKGGKIAAERYYYDPSLFAQAAQPQRPPTPSSTPPPRPSSGGVSSGGISSGGISRPSGGTSFGGSTPGSSSGSAAKPAEQPSGGTSRPGVDPLDL
jgi:hypothetical protein